MPVRRGVLLMDWIRKHLLSLSDVCKKCQQDPALSVDQRKDFAEVYRTTTRFSSLPSAGGPQNVASVIANLCGACRRGAIRRGCQGRQDWKQSCALLDDHHRHHMSGP